MKHYDPSILAEFFRRHENAVGKIARGDVVRDMCSMFGFSWGTAHLKLKAIREGRSVFDLSSGKKKSTPRKSAEERKIMQQDMMKLAAIKYKQGEGHGMVPTELALIECCNRDLFEGRTYHRGKVDRWLKEHGLNKQSLNRPKAAQAMKADFSNSLWMCDATVLSHYYLSIDDNRTILEINTPLKDQHLDDLLHRKKAKKIWVYYLTEKYSKAYFVMAFAPTPIGTNSVNGGENSIDLLTFLSFCFLSKRDLPLLRGKAHPFEGCVIEGAPQSFYSDPGSAFRSDAVTNFLLNLGIEPERHLPGNAKATGSVEARIGAAKRGPDMLINKNNIHTLDDLNYHLMAWANFLNTKHKKYEIYLEGCKKNPLRNVSMQNIEDAVVMYLERVVDGWGCISLQKTRYFVDENIVGEKIRIYRQPATPGSKVLVNEDVLIAVDRYNRRFQLVNHEPHSFGDFKSFVKTDSEKMRDEVRVLSQNLRKSARFEDSLPPQIETNIRHLPPKSESVKTHSMIVPDKFENIKLATDWVLIELENSGIKEHEPELPASLNQEFTKVFDILGYIPGDLAERFVRTIHNNKMKRIG